MNQWHFVIAAYALGGIAMLALTLASLFQMRKAERAAEALKRR
ncbi:heme exporter protein CcmD [Sphingomonas oryzagri]|uniref:Heme exporter protein D n=1 Tax=Sphingomonas oryzagri TaxID=3042314 RepID=A0ABT6MXX8_9SPHN|nr:heme exporter protein CcmD [Sphingomonas oryzagri]MDH7637900.1 heme exporter protein CcmD [Sphingomonas oryzagri]